MSHMSEDTAHTVMTRLSSTYCQSSAPLSEGLPWTLRVLWFWVLDATSTFLLHVIMPPGSLRHLHHAPSQLQLSCRPWFNSSWRWYFQSDPVWSRHRFHLFPAAVVWHLGIIINNGTLTNHRLITFNQTLKRVLQKFMYDTLHWVLSFWTPLWLGCLVSLGLAPEELRGARALIQRQSGIPVCATDKRVVSPIERGG